MRVLVTGGAGFIGSHLVRALLARGDAVRVLDDFSTGRRENLEDLLPRVELVEGDVCEPAVAEAAAAGVDAVLHEAAEVSVPRSIEEPLRCAEVNVLGTLRILEAARRAGARRFVLASSCAVYGDRGEAPIPEDAPTAPLSPYAASKLAAEGFVTAAARLHGLAALSLRYFNVYGRGQDPSSAYAAVVPKLAMALAGGTGARIFGDGEQTRDFVHVEDVVRANLRALEAPAAAWGGAFNVGTGVSSSLNGLAEALGRLLGTDERPTHVPGRAGDLRHSRACPERARRELGFSAELSLEEGLARTLESFRGPPAGGG